MASLTDREKRELLEDALSEARKRDFQILREHSKEARLSGKQWVAFLDWAQPYMLEDVKKRGPIKGSRFVL